MRQPHFVNIACGVAYRFLKVSVNIYKLHKSEVSCMCSTVLDPECYEMYGSYNNAVESRSRRNMWQYENCSPPVIKGR
jgi:hypothetical protein